MTRIKWLTHACFRITTNTGYVIYTDPYKIESGETPADIILASHDHFDHADGKSIKNIIQEDTVVICPKSSSSKLAKFNAKGIDPNDSLDIEGIRITAVPAYNPNKAFHPKGNKWIGFIIEVDGKRIYHAGDTDVIPEMKNVSDIDVALIPVGDTYTMGFKEAVECLNIIKPKIAVPMHDWDKDLNEFSKMVSSTDSGVKVEILKGKDLEI